MKLLPERGYTGRIRIYFSEMFPIPKMFIGAALLYLSFSLFLARIHGIQMEIISVTNLIGSLSLLMIMLILRLMDEIKDRETDLQLFSHRPLPSGRVQERDIIFSLKGVIACYVAINLFSPATLWMALMVLAYTFLMFRYFFIPTVLKRSLLLNLATHNPIVPIMLTYVLALFAAEHGLGPGDLSWNYVCILVVMYWTMFFAWEISRKIRSAEEEDDYVTYSKIFGPFGAVSLALGAQTVTLAAALVFDSAMSMPILFLLIVWTGYLITMGGYLRFIARPNHKTSNLGPFAEKYIIMVNAAFIASHALTI
jgi:4-hydroxybenzoate polyprenyltransferase